MKSILLEKGIIALMPAVDTAVDLDPSVRKADGELNAVLATLEILLGPQRYESLEAAISAARGADTGAAFRVGITEGLRMANDVRTLIGPEKEGEA